MLIQRSDCKDHWCENYDKNSWECDRCEKQTRSRDAPDLRVILRRRVEELIGNEHGDGKITGEINGQEI